MGYLSRLLIFSALLSSSAALLVVLADSSYCVNLRCEWRGIGKHCKPERSFRRAYQQDDFKFHYPSLSDDESEASILERLQAEHPMNTFTVAKDVVVGKKCKGRRLWCNAVWMYPQEDYDSFLKLVQNPGPYTIPPKLQCRPSFPIS